MRKLQLIGFTLMVVMFLASCGGGNSGPSEEEYENYKPSTSEKKISSQNNSISGELGDYLTIKNLETNVSYLGMNKPFAQEWSQEWEIKINVERTSIELEHDIEILNGNYTHLILYMFDNSGSPITGLGTIQNVSGHDLVDQVLALDEGQDAWVTFKYREGNLNEEDVISKWDQFSLSSEIGFVKKSSPVTKEDEDEEGDSEAMSDFLDDYEDYVNDYVKIIEKMKADPEDMSIMTDYSNMMGKSTKWASDMQKISGGFGSEEMARMLEIQKKLAKAAM